MLRTAGKFCPVLQASVLPVPPVVPLHCKQTAVGMRKFPDVAQEAPEVSFVPQQYAVPLVSMAQVLGVVPNLLTATEIGLVRGVPIAALGGLVEAVVELLPSCPTVLSPQQRKAFPDVPVAVPVNRHE